MFFVHRAPALLLATGVVLSACGGGDAETGRQAGAQRGARGPAGGGNWGGPAAPAAAVPVQVATVQRRTISSFIETNGTLEAENEVDVVARISAPIVDLRVEEGMAVRRDQLLARLDDVELRSAVEVARVSLTEARLAYERAQRLHEVSLISPEEYEQIRSRFETARAQLEGNEILLGYSEIKAPFAGLIVTRYVDFAQQVSPNTPLFRLSDFSPLLCPIQVPERELPKLAVGQAAYLQVEAWAGERFDASVLRVSPVVDPATGTVKVTLEVDAKGRLTPGMFARVFIETEARPDALVIPKSALSLESIGDTVYVAEGGVAARREVSLGFTEGDSVEVVSGLDEAEQVVVVGQDGLSDGTPIQILEDSGPRMAGTPPPADEASPGAAGPPTAVAESPPTDSSGSGVQRRRGAPGGAPGGSPPFAGGGRPGGRPDLSQMTPEQLERAKEFMRSRGLTEEQIEERIRQARARSEESSGSGTPN